MKFFLALFVWFAIAALMGASIWVFTVKGNPWFMIVAALAFVGGIWKIGCTTH